MFRALGIEYGSSFRTRRKKSRGNDAHSQGFASPQQGRPRIRLFQSMVRLACPLLAAALNARWVWLMILTYLPVTEATAELRVGYVNFRAGGSRTDGDGRAREAKIQFLLSQVASLGLTVLVMVEVWGTWKSMQCLRQRFRDEAGMESRGKEGPAEGQQRVGGCLIFWKAARVKSEQTLFSSLQLDLAATRGNGGSIMLRIAGWDRPLTIVAAYGPQEREDKIRFTASLRAFLGQIDGSYIMAGDLQGVVCPEHTASGRSLYRHEEDLAGMLEDGNDGAKAVGRRLHITVEDSQCPFTHRDPRGHHASIDHFIVDSEKHDEWSVGLASFPRVAIGSYSGRPFDHAFMVAVHQPPERKALADSRLIRVSTRWMSPALRQDVEQNISRMTVEGELNAPAQLRLLEKQMTTLIRDTCESKRDMPTHEVAHLGSAKEHVKYLTGVQKAINLRWSDAAFFTSWRSPLLAHGMWKDIARKYSRQGWQRVRRACRSKVASRLAFYSHLAYVQKDKLVRSAAQGQVTFDSPQTAARMLQEAWKEFSSGKRGGVVSMSKINVQQGTGDETTTTLLTNGTEVMQAMSDYGTAQNRASRARPEVVRAMLETFCPRWPELKGEDGEDWDLAKAFSFTEFLKIVHSFAQKACGLDGFQVDFLPLASAGVQKTYHALLRQCMIECHFPSEWAVLVGVLIEKKTPAPFDIQLNRDIWLVAAGAKLTQKFLQWHALEPVRARLLPCAAGSVRGRSGSEHVLTQRLLIRQVLDLRGKIYILWVDLVKCFMSFSRECSQEVQEHLGVPQAVRDVLRAMYAEVKGRYDSAYGMTPLFNILRGLIQGALESPDLSLQLLNVMAEIMDLKVLGCRHFNGSGRGARTVQMLYVDDGANTLDEEEHLHRAAFVWNVWAMLFDTEVNVKKFEKSVVSGLTHSPLSSDRHALRPASANLVRQVRLLNGTVIPQMRIEDPYPYLGVFISLDGKCAHHLQYVVQKFKGATALLASRPACRRRKAQMINPFTLGYGIAHGVGLNLSFNEADSTLGVLARMPLRCAKHARARATSTPRWMAHAPSKPFANSTARARARRKKHLHDEGLAAIPPAPLVCGLNLVHPFAAICAGKHIAFWSCFSSPSPQMRQATHSAVALTLRRLGCRGEDPSTFDFSQHVHALDMSHDVENWLWCLYIISGRRCGWRWCTTDGRAPADSALRFTRGEGLFGKARGSPPIWQGDLWNRAKRTTLRQLMPFVDELAHVCTTSGEWLADFQEARKRWGAAGLERSMRADWDLLIKELQSTGVQPCPGRGDLSLAQLHSGQQTLQDALANNQSRSEPPSTGEWNVEQLTRLLTDGQAHSADAFKAAFEDMRGSAAPRRPEEHPLAAPSRWELAGGARRHICWYNSKQGSHAREWKQHDEGGAGVPVAGDAARSERLLYLRSRFHIQDDGLLADLSPSETRPAIIRLWLEAEKRVTEAGLKPNHVENAFVLDRLLVLEASFSFSHAAATDGSVDRKEGVLTAGRAALVAGEDGFMAIGGSMSPRVEGFDTQSYDTELEAFSDVLSKVAEAPQNKRRVVIVTDCLSGAQALWRFHRRSMRERSGCYRDNRLAGLLIAENRCELVAYIWLHSHVNITLSEGADLAAKAAREGAHAPSLTLLRPHAIALVPGVKRGHASAMIEAVSAWILEDKLLGCSQRSLRPTQATWEAFLCRDVERSPFASDEVIETLDDLQGDRLGLQGDRVWALAPRGSYGWFLRGQPCAVCHDPACRQTREDVLLSCQGVAAERAALGLALRSVAPDVPSAQWAVCAVEGGSMPEAARLDAVRFLCGLPNAPGEWDEECTQDTALQRRVGRQVYGAVNKLVQRVMHLNRSARASPARPAEGTWTWEGVRGLGLLHRWEITSWCTRVLRAWRSLTSNNGPARTRARARARPLRLELRSAAERNQASAVAGAGDRAQEMLRAVRTVVSTARAPTGGEAILLTTCRWAMRRHEEAAKERARKVSADVAAKWTDEVEELLPPQARAHELDDIFFGEMAGGWRWRLAGLLAAWRRLSARSYLARRDASLAHNATPYTRYHLRWDQLRALPSTLPVPLGTLRSFIAEEVQVAWGVDASDTRHLVPAAADSSREAHRILRARHAIGVLSLTWNVDSSPGPNYEAALAALEAEQQHVDRDTWHAARRRLELAWYCCRGTAARRRLIEQTLASPRPITDELWCPIDAEALRSWMLTPDAQTVPRHKDGTTYGVSGWQLASELLQACTGDGEVLWLRIKYRHAALGDWLLAAGWVTYSRMYAIGADPFRLPSHIRRIALGKFGWELDDAAAYIRIIARLVPSTRQDVEAFVRSRDDIMRGVARSLLQHLPEREASAAAKGLFLASIFGGDVFRWKAAHGVVGSVGELVVPTATSGPFRVGDFCSRLRQAADTFACAHPRLSQLVHGCGRKAGAVLSYAAQNLEGMLLKAKRMWADINGHYVFNLQHDGVAAGLAVGTSGASAAMELSLIETAALGGVGMRVTAQHTGQEPEPFVAANLAAEGQADWEARTGRYSRTNDAADATSTAVSAASTEQLELRVTLADAERRQATLEVLRCAQAGLRTRWPSPPRRSPDLPEAPPRDAGQLSIEDAAAASAVAPAIPEEERWVIDLRRQGGERRRRRARAAKAANRIIKRTLGRGRQGLGRSGSRTALGSASRDEAAAGEALLRWAAQGSCSGSPLDGVSQRIFLDLTGNRGRRAARATKRRLRERQRERLNAELTGGVRADDAGRSAVRCILSVARPSVRRGTQLWVLVRWEGLDDDGTDIWQDDCLPITWLTRDLIPVARAMEALRYRELHAGTPPPAKATRRSSRLAQNSAPAVPAPSAATDLEIVAKLGTVMGAHLLRQVDAGLQGTDLEVARSLGAMQKGAVDRAVMDDQWRERDLNQFLEECVECPQQWVRARQPKGTR